MEKKLKDFPKNLELKSVFYRSGYHFHQMSSLLKMVVSLNLAPLVWMLQSLIVGSCMEYGSILNKNLICGGFKIWKKK